MVSAQEHRGPDDSGEWYCTSGGNTVGFGHRRLSFLDLSPRGHQPMEDSESGDVVTYNGELYNFRSLRASLEREGCTFRSDSDTEVVLRALSRWGVDALRRFEGMYALAWYRRRERSVVVARDPLGIKPLYYAHAPGALLFATEVRAILASNLVSRATSPQGIAGLLAYGAVQEPHTFFRDVHPIPAGHWAEVPVDAAPGEHPVRPHRFWSFPALGSAIPEAEAIDAVRTTMDAAVRDHLIADVPVGVFLSSGIDSTIIAGLAARHAPDIEAFTVAFGDNADMSEGVIAAQTARRFGIPHHDIQITMESSLRATEPWLAAQDQPSMDGLNVYLVSQAVRAHGIKAALSGQGGDEVFGGYPSFAEVPRVMRIMRAIRMVPRALRGPLVNAMAFRRSAASRDKFVDMLLTDGSPVELTLARRRVLASRHLSALGLNPGAIGLDATYQTPEGVTDASSSDRDAVYAIAQAEARYYMGNMLLRDCDANGMAHSLEIRVPFLDQRVFDACMAWPGSVRLPHGGCTKHLLRAGFSDLLSPEILNQPKVGFILPIKRWMAGPMRDMCTASLDYLKQTGIVRPQGVDLVWDGFVRDPESPMWSRAWTLVVLGAYAKRMRAEGAGAAEPARMGDAGIVAPTPAAAGI